MPALNYGVDVTRTDTAIAGDGPIVAAGLAALDEPVTLVSNQTGTDPAGDAIHAQLAAWGVHWQPTTTPTARTRVNTVICDPAGNRTWFSDLRGIADELAGITTGGGGVYIDCYEVLAEAPRPVITAALNIDADLLVNLGGSPVPPWLANVLNGRRLPILQTNADEDDPGAAMRQLDTLRTLTIADLIVVTAGRRGAIAALGDSPVVRAAAIPVVVEQVQGAGAVFSAALLHRRAQGDELVDALRFACAAGSTWCTRSPNSPLPTTDDVTAALSAS
jgi:sugar/nucleoside kinase (ribokinase family)